MIENPFDLPRTHQNFCNFIHLTPLDDHNCQLTVKRLSFNCQPTFITGPPTQTQLRNLSLRTLPHRTLHLDRRPRPDAPIIIRQSRTYHATILLECIDRILSKRGGEDHRKLDKRGGQWIHFVQTKTQK